MKQRGATLGGAKVYTLRYKVQSLEILDEGTFEEDQLGGETLPKSRELLLK